MVYETREQKRKKAEQYLRYHASLLKAGESMPSIRLLMQVSGVGRPTLEAGLQMLLDENILEVRERSGYYRTDNLLGGSKSENIIDIVACSVIGYLDVPNGFAQKFINALVTLAASFGYSCRIHRVGLSEPLSVYQDLIAKYNIKQSQFQKF